jgi:hypothetical protein
MVNHGALSWGCSLSLGRSEEQGGKRKEQGFRPTDLGELGFASYPEPPLPSRT